MRDTSWMAEAKCAGMDVNQFFPDAVGVAGQRQTQAALRICDQCPVQLQCARHAQELHVPYGVWGGRNRTSKRAPRRTEDFHHGDEAGAARHRRRGEAPCASCRRGERLARSMRGHR